MFERIDELVAEHAELEQRLADPSVHSDAANARKLSRRYAELSAIVKTYKEWRQAGDDRSAALELARDDDAFAEEAEQLATRQTELEDELRRLMLPRDPHDDRDVIVEIKAGAGGDESALFAADLLRMYMRYAERNGWRAEMLVLAPDCQPVGDWHLEPPPLLVVEVASPSTRGVDQGRKLSDYRFGGAGVYLRVDLPDVTGDVHFEVYDFARDRLTTGHGVVDVTVGETSVRFDLTALATRPSPA